MQEIADVLEKGTQVRLRNDPGRQGVITGKVREQAGTRKYQVMFPEGKSYQPEYELEVIEDDDSDPYELLSAGRFGRAADLRRNLSHIQLSGRLANLVYSMDATNTEFLAYQFKPVLSFLESPSSGLLIADEVGLGKTIEAGLIWTELRARFDARRLVVLCPAMLREKWREELRERFSVDATISNAEEFLGALKRGKHEVPDGQGLVCSVQGLRPPRRYWDEEATAGGARRALARFLDEHADGEPLIDLLIIDEAHYLRNPESQNAKLGQLLRGVSASVVLLSATPINLRDDDLFHLLNLVDPDSFDVKQVFPQVLAANEPLQRARSLALNMQATREQVWDALRDAQAHPLLRDSRQLRELISGESFLSNPADRAGRVQLANRIERINLLRHAVNRTRKVEVTEWRVVREPFTQFVELDPEGAERALYDEVTAAVRQYALRADISEGFLLATPQRQLSSCMYAAVRAWRDRSDIDPQQAYEDLGVESGGEGDVSPLIDHLCRHVLPKVDAATLRAQDSKYKKFRAILGEYLAGHPDEKVIVFSYFRGTLRYLHERLSEDGIESQVLLGGMRDSKHEIIKRFRDHDRQRVLLSSEVASEGVDLQFSRLLINYDLPWNPMKVEQRIGRIDRIGQKADKISIWNLCYADTIDHRIYDRLFMRLGIFERALGGMDAILGEKIAELTGQLLRDQLTPEQERARIDSAALALERIRADQEDLENQASHLIAHSGYIMEQVHAAHEFRKRITEGDLLAYVKDYLDRFAQGHQFKQIKKDELIFAIKLPPALAASLDDFIRRKKLFGQTRLAAGTEVECLFLNKVRRPGERMELISQFHPLVRFISEDLHARNEGAYPLVALTLDHQQAGVQKGVYAFVVNRWSFVGIRTEEEIRARVVRLDDQTLLEPDESWDLINRARLEGADWLSVGAQVATGLLENMIDLCDGQLRRDFEEAKRHRENENDDRVQFQIQSAERHRDRQLLSRQRALEEHKLKGQTRGVMLMQGQINKVKERFDIQVAKLRRQAALEGSPHDVCMGALLVR